MILHADLHAHSVFAGGAGSGTIEKKLKIMKKRFLEAALFSPLKGVNLIGTGDVQFTPYTDFLKESLTEVDTGVFEYPVIINELEEEKKKRNIEFNSQNPPNYILQTEVIFTANIGTKGRKKSHSLILFPDFTRIEEFNELLDGWKVAREQMARPFIVSKDSEDIGEKVNSILDLDKTVELIPAHIMAPEGVYGGNNGANRLSEFYGDAATRISSVETGLSADPDTLGLIPELDKKTLISNADAHSSALNRLGREFTSFNVSKCTYNALISAIRENRVEKTAEFHPSEGKYFLTGHRENRKKPGHHGKGEFCIYSPKNVPKNNICPICQKELTIGVLQRSFEVGKEQGEEREIGKRSKNSFVTMIPLIEILGFTYGIKTFTSKKVLNEYYRLISIIDTEVSLWLDDSKIKLLEGSTIHPDIIENIKQVKAGNFSFSPGGYDGTYGKLVIGTTESYLNIGMESTPGTKEKLNFNN